MAAVARRRILVLQTRFSEFGESAAAFKACQRLARDGHEVLSTTTTTGKEELKKERKAAEGQQGKRGGSTTLISPECDPHEESRTTWITTKLYKTYFSQLVNLERIDMVVTLMPGTTKTGMEIVKELRRKRGGKTMVLFILLACTKLGEDQADVYTEIEDIIQAADEIWSIGPDLFAHYNELFMGYNYKGHKRPKHKELIFMPTKKIAPGLDRFWESFFSSNSMVRVVSLWQEGTPYQYKGNLVKAKNHGSSLQDYTCVCKALGKISSELSLRKKKLEWDILGPEDILKTMVKSIKDTQTKGKHNFPINGLTLPASSETFCAKRLRKSTVFIAPDKTEDTFNFAAYEAIKFGIPTLVSSDSSVGKILGSLSCPVAARALVELTGDWQHDSEQWKTAIYGQVLSDFEKARSWAKELSKFLLDSPEIQSYEEDVFGPRGGGMGMRGSSIEVEDTASSGTEESPKSWYTTLNSTHPPSRPISAHSHTTDAMSREQEVSPDIRPRASSFGRKCFPQRLPVKPSYLHDDTDDLSPHGYAPKSVASARTLLRQMSLSLGDVTLPARRATLVTDGIDANQNLQKLDQGHVYSPIPEHEVKNFSSSLRGRAPRLPTPCADPFEDHGLLLGPPSPQDHMMGPLHDNSGLGPQDHNYLGLSAKDHKAGAHYAGAQGAPYAGAHGAQYPGAQYTGAQGAPYAGAHGVQYPGAQGAHGSPDGPLDLRVDAERVDLFGAQLDPEMDLSTLEAHSSPKVPRHSTPNARLEVAGPRSLTRDLSTPTPPIHPREGPDLGGARGKPRSRSQSAERSRHNSAGRSRHSSGQNKGASPPVLLDPSMVCLTHQKYYEFYCEDTMRPLCMDCANEPYHSMRSIVRLTEVEAMMKISVKTSYHQTCRKHRELQHRRKNLRQAMQSVQNKATVAIRKINKRREFTYDMLERVATSMITHVRSTAQEEQRKLYDELTHIDDSMKVLLRQHSSTNAVLKTSPSTEFIKQAKVVMAEHENNSVQDYSNPVQDITTMEFLPALMSTNNPGRAQGFIEDCLLGHLKKASEEVYMPSDSMLNIFDFSQGRRPYYSSSNIGASPYGQLHDETYSSVSSFRSLQIGDRDDELSLGSTYEDIEISRSKSETDLIIANNSAAVEHEVLSFAAEKEKKFELSPATATLIATVSISVIKPALEGVLDICHSADGIWISGYYTPERWKTPHLCICHLNGSTHEVELVYDTDIADAARPSVLLESNGRLIYAKRKDWRIFEINPKNPKQRPVVTYSMVTQKVGALTGAGKHMFFTDASPNNHGSIQVLKWKDSDLQYKRTIRTNIKTGNYLNLHLGLVSFQPEIDPEVCMLVVSDSSDVTKNVVALDTDGHTHWDLRKHPSELLWRNDVKKATDDTTLSDVKTPDDVTNVNKAKDAGHVKNAIDKINAKKFTKAENASDVSNAPDSRHDPVDLNDLGSDPSFDLDPAGVCADSRCNVYIADRRHHRVLVVTPDGRQVYDLLGREQGVDHPSKLCMAMGGRQLGVLNKGGREIALYDVDLA